MRLAVFVLLVASSRSHKVDLHEKLGGCTRSPFAVDAARHRASQYSTKWYAQQMLRPTQVGMHRQVQSLNSSACRENLSLTKNSNLCWRLRPTWPASLLSKLLDP
ncbi:hypothetical protein NW765_005106 [Fusarium oxysporum]|nr:hypothetical protein NW765_005106 [Fusarium oxysporum]KAJ4281383.1 hypothetical protein NW764_004076 [Fusarium oxysporum]